MAGLPPVKNRANAPDITFFQAKRRIMRVCRLTEKEAHTGLLRLAMFLQVPKHEAARLVIAYKIAKLNDDGNCARCRQSIQSHSQLRDLPLYLCCNGKLVFYRA